MSWKPQRDTCDDVHPTTETLLTVHRNDELFRNDAPFVDATERRRDDDVSGRAAQPLQDDAFNNEIARDSELQIYNNTCKRNHEIPICNNHR